MSNNMRTLMEALEPMMNDKETFDWESEMGTGVVIQDNTRGGYDVSIEGKYINNFAEMDEALVAIEHWMNKNQYWPNIFFINDHGNVTHIDREGNEINSIVEVSNKEMVKEESYGMKDVLEALQDLLDSTSLQAFASNKHSAQLKAQKILDSFGVTTTMREVDPMADPDDFGVQDDITNDPSQHLPTNVFYSIKELPGDERFGEPDEFIIWRHEGGSSSAVGNPGDAQSVEQAEALIAADAKRHGLGNRYEIEYR